MKRKAAELTGEGLRILIMAAAVIGGGRLVPAEAKPQTVVVDLQPVKEELANIRTDLRDHDRRLFALERRP